MELPKPETMDGWLQLHRFSIGVQVFGPEVEELFRDGLLKKPRRTQFFQGAQYEFPFSFPLETKLSVSRSTCNKSNRRIRAMSVLLRPMTRVSRVLSWHYRTRGDILERRRLPLN